MSTSIHTLLRGLAVAALLLMAPLAFSTSQGITINKAACDGEKCCRDEGDTCGDLEDYDEATLLQRWFGCGPQQE